MTSSVADSLVGRVIDGRYRVLSHLADGGMASVYVALDARLDRDVALKIMRPGLATDAVFVERFRSEARSAARLSHPNVVAVFDQGEDAGDVFLAMELVEGKTLRDVIHEEAPLTAREAIAILEPILLALQAAHSAGLIHRDVKPENVIVRRDGEVKVADFGLARAITNQTTTSQTGVLLGTVSYLSPEQVERGVADQRSDLYAAGLLLFEMLTGRKAVSGDTPIQIAYKHVHGSIDAPSAVVPTVPARLDDLVARATALEPDDRFASAGDFLRALQHVRRDLSPAELDRRGTAVGATALSPVIATTATLPPVHDNRSPSPYAAPSVRAEGDGGDPGAQRNDADGIPPRARQRSSLAGLPVHDEPQLSHTAALPLQRRRARRRWPWWVAALLLVGGGAAGWWFTVGPGGMTVVPAVVGQQLTAADTALRQASLSLDENEEFSETAAKGIVLRIEPDPGTQLSKDSIVRVVVSKGQERYDVPSLVGTKADDLAKALSPLTLTVGERTSAWNEKVPEGEVISQDPKAGTSVKRGVAVSVVVSKGPQPISVPSVVGADAGAASAAITKAGLKAVRADDVNSDTVPTGQVVSQAPAKGSLFRGDSVTITVSKGPVMVQVPGVVGRPTAEAEKALTDLGFKVQKDYPFGKLFDLVRVQSIDGGQQAPKGSTIILTIV
ncbi:serine/threonine-protein kinase [Humibacillus xanthopallidus]|uniref:non-specific serine/threonine protein kinase n=1 Tax=Humibacillus xanthopallidus TaxID=412689 RepID=A0A543PU50_9MICO|nr:Stk1 family PASTA domain-containing Ser/Thr kinase [Humibacillus xanthopallidus]TQN47576.1 serine/threonine-protein kinase [Humibacillus xanthopallidus]